MNKIKKTKKGKKKNAKKCNKTKPNTNTTRRRLRRQMKGGARNLRDINFGSITHQTMGDCIKELIEASYKLYLRLLQSSVHTTIVCGGQSPAYYCLAMMNFKIYNPKLVDIVILPHSKNQEKSADPIRENIAYCKQLQKKGIVLRPNVVIIDGVHSGTGILALESALQHCWGHQLIIKKVAINAFSGTRRIPVDEEIFLRCEPKFSDIFPRLVTQYLPHNFDNASMFITDFIGLRDNPIAEMIIEISRQFPENLVEDSDWYKLNNEITEEVSREKVIQQIKDAEAEARDKFYSEKKIKDDQLRTQSYETIVLTNPKRYQCPVCNSISGTALIITHDFDCENNLKIPMEPK